MDHFCVQVEPWDIDAIGAHLRSHGVETGELVTRYGTLGQRSFSIWLGSRGQRGRAQGTAEILSGG